MIIAELKQNEINFINGGFFEGIGKWAGWWIVEGLIFYCGVSVTGTVLMLTVSPITTFHIFVASVVFGPPTIEGAVRIAGFGEQAGEFIGKKMDDLISYLVS